MVNALSKVLNIDKKRDSWWFAKNLPEVLIKSNKVAAGAAVWQKIQLGFLLRLRSPQSASSVELCTMLYILYNVQYTQTYDTPISELIKLNYCTTYPFPKSLWSAHYGTLQQKIFCKEVYSATTYWKKVVFLGNIWKHYCKSHWKEIKDRKCWYCRGATTFDPEFHAKWVSQRLPLCW